MIGEAALDEIMAVMDAAFEPHWREAWNRLQVADSLAMPSTMILMVDADARQIIEGAAVGFALSRQALDEEELLLFAVHPDHRGRGLGARMLDVYFSAARQRGTRRVFLEMRANNPAGALYRRAGFVPIGTRPRYYRAANGEAIDAITFARRL